MDPRYSRKSAEDYLKFSKILQVPHGLMLLEKLKPKEGNYYCEVIYRFSSKTLKLRFKATIGCCFNLFINNNEPEC